MPEGLEVERYREAAMGLVGRTIARVTHADPLVVADGVSTVLPGYRFDAVRRVGKVLVLETDGPALGLRFGMTGRLVVDSTAPVARLAYGAADDHARWDRFVVELRDGGAFRLHDPRRFGRILLDPDVDDLGPDLLVVTRDQLGRALGRRRAPLKAVLLDQHAIAGLGNMLVDELLWWAGLDPRRPAATLSAGEVKSLHGAMRRRLPVMLRRGGSHTGVLSPNVRAGGHRCRRDGAALARTTIAGRTTVWCPVHQQ